MPEVNESRLITKKCGVHIQEAGSSALETAIDENLIANRSRPPLVMLSDNLKCGRRQKRLDQLCVCYDPI
jgi:hypothetical protein